MFNASVVGRTGASHLVSRAADGSGGIERLAENMFATGISPDGSQVMVFGGEPLERWDRLSLLALGTRQLQPLVHEFGAQNGVISPDGRWLAYESDASGQAEIYVRSFPDVDTGHRQVSMSGGVRPLWARNGRELFFVTGPPGGRRGLERLTALMSVAIEPGPTWKAGTPTRLFEGNYFVLGGFGFRHYDVSPDGQRFLMIKEIDREQTVTPGMVVVQNWTAMLP